MINLLQALDRMGIVKRLLLAVAGFGIYLCGTEVEPVFGGSALLVSWTLHVVGLLMTTPFGLLLAEARGSPYREADESLSDEDDMLSNQTTDLRYSYRLDNWNNPDYWHSPNRSLDSHNLFD
jgi:hypothetical protein